MIHYYICAQKFRYCFWQRSFGILRILYNQRLIIYYVIITSLFELCYRVISTDIGSDKMYKHAQRSLEGSERNVRSLYGRHRGVGYVVSRNSLLGTPLRPLLASSISFINGVTCYGRTRSRVHGHTRDENVTRTHACLHTFIPYGDRSGSVTRIAMGSLLKSRMQLEGPTSLLYRQSYIS